MGDRSADDTGQGGEPHLGIGSGFVADEHSVKPLDEALKRFVIGEQSHDHGIELQRVGRPAMFHGMVDDQIQSNSRASMRQSSASATSSASSSMASSISATAMISSSLVLNWW